MNYHNTMQISIDKAGRLLIPKPVRDQYRLFPGASLELEKKTDGILLKIESRGPSLIRKQGILIHHGSQTVNIDIAGFVNDERERRSNEIAAEKTPE